MGSCLGFETIFDMLQFMFNELEDLLGWERYIRSCSHGNSVSIIYHSPTVEKDNSPDS